MSGFNVCTSLTNRQQIDAICWAAKQAGMSYGEFCTAVTYSALTKAFDDYEAVLRQRAAARKAEEERLKRKRQQKKRACK